MESLNSRENRTILFALMNGSDNIESCQTLADILQENDFRIVFAVDKISSQLIDKTLGYDQQVFNTQPLLDLSEIDLDALNGSSIETIKCLGHRIITEKFEFVRRCEEFNQEIIERIRPELIIIESMVCSPALTNSGIPWIWLNFGASNLCKNDHRIPPGWSGLSLQKSTVFKAFREQWNEVFTELKHQINNWCVSKGAPDLPNTIFHPHSPYLNFHVHPLELRYKLADTLQMKEWQQIDCLLKNKSLKRFVIPEALQCKPGKLIYLSMGPFASLKLMKRLTTILGESANKFIVTKGRFHNQYELPDNMWGEEDLPLIDVIQSVNLVLTSADNNSIFQCLLNAKPMIALPLFGEQLDNRIRLKECGFGWGLDPFTCNKETLICMIESTLDDIALARRLANIAHSMNRSETFKQMANQIEKMLDRLDSDNKTNVLSHQSSQLSSQLIQTPILGQVED